MPRTAPVQASIAPSLTQQRAIELIGKQLEKYDEIIKLHRNNPEVATWQNTTEGILDATFGKPNGDHHDNTNKFLNTDWGFQVGRPDVYYERLHQESMARKRAVLKSILEQLDLLAPPAAQVASGKYVFHSEIERVSGDLFRDGHYKQAALEAYIRVIDEVKIRSGLPLDGDNLMNHTFGCDGGKVPILKFNSLATDAERDEQKGFLYMFKGIVGLRNSKAHSNRLFNDPLRAHDYLSLASLLMRLLELSSK
jgi:uncharacterized protein (TIGR02391 family)